MKKLLLLFLLFSPLMLSAQKISESKIDDFTGEKVIYTSWEKIKTGNGMTGKNNFIFRLRFENNTIYIHLKWVTASLTSIKEGSILTFKFNNNEMATFKCLEYVISGKGLGATGLSMSALEGIDPIYTGNFDLFGGNNFAVKFRINTTDGYVDIDLKEKDALKINTAYQLLVDEINK